MTQPEIDYILESIKTHGSIRRSLLGVRAVTLSPMIAERIGTDATTGAYVIEVFEDSAARTAGIQE